MQSVRSHTGSEQTVTSQITGFSFNFTFDVQTEKTKQQTTHAQILLLFVSRMLIGKNTLQKRTLNAFHSDVCYSQWASDILQSSLTSRFGFDY